MARKKQLIYHCDGEKVDRIVVSTGDSEIAFVQVSEVEIFGCSERFEGRVMRENQLQACAHKGELPNTPLQLMRV